MRLKLVLFVLAVSPLAAGEFRAGAATADITPEKWPVPLIGSFSHRQATKAWDPLNARSLVLDDGATRLAIVVVDSCYAPRALFDEAKRRASKRTGIPTDRMLMAATHTHSAPPSKNTFLERAPPEYLERLIRGIVESLDIAVANLAPAQIGWGTVDAPEHVFNRRWHMKPGGIAPNPFGGTSDIVRMNPPRQSDFLERPAGPTDPQVVFLSVRSRSGRPLALLANYSLHYVGGVPPGGVSADYFGEFANQIQSRLAPDDNGSPPFVGILSNGTSGNINNINFEQPRQNRKPFEQIRIVARSLADKVAAALPDVSHQQSGTLAMAQRELAVTLRRPTRKELERAKAFLAEPDESRLPRRAKAYAKMTLDLANRPPVEHLILQAVRISEAGIASIPCEVFVEIGLEIKDKSPLKPTFTIELANGHYNYLPT
ncbi:MAG: hypothetical protein GY953_48420, partial [bacterium]|nr:hypothetical protein [bacterium]